MAVKSGVLKGTTSVASIAITCQTITTQHWILDLVAITWKVILWWTLLPAISANRSSNNLSPTKTDRLYSVPLLNGMKLGNSDRRGVVGITSNWTPSRFRISSDCKCRSWISAGDHHNLTFEVIWTVVLVLLMTSWEKFQIFPQFQMRIEMTAHDVVRHGMACDTPQHSPFAIELLALFEQVLEVLVLLILSDPFSCSIPVWSLIFPVQISPHLICFKLLNLAVHLKCIHYLLN